MAGLVQVRTTLTANGTALPLAGNMYETMMWPGDVRFAVYADTGATVNGIVTSGIDTLFPLALLPILAVATPIIQPDHYVLSDLVNKGEKLMVFLQEAAAGTPIVRTHALITRIA